MGSVYAKTYFPVGYEEFIDNTVNKEDLVEVEKFITKHKDSVKEIADRYAEMEVLFRKSKDEFLERCKSESEGDLDVAEERIIYDTLVAHKVCAFWLNLIQQPMETYKQYYNDNKLNIENTFYKIKDEYKLEKGPEELIGYYRNYCC